MSALVLEDSQRNRLKLLVWVVLGVVYLLGRQDGQAAALSAIRRSWLEGFAHGTSSRP